MLPSLYPHMLNGLLLSILLIVGLRPLAKNLHLVDLPSGRKRHDGQVPLCGGLAIFVAFMLGGFGLDEAYRLPWNWALGFLLLVLIGLADDRWRLPPLPRLAAETIAAAVLSTGIGALLVVGAGIPAPWHIAAPALVAALSILFIVGTANAVNMLDGADGLAGATVAAALFWLALIALHVGDRAVAVQAIVLIAAIIGFLVFNMRHPWRACASVFLGDAGSTILGGVLATFVLCLASEGRPAPAVSCLTLAWLVVVPICDTLSLMVRRIAAGRNPFSSDRWHLHHLLLDCGASPAVVAPMIAGASALCGAVAYCGIILRVPDIYLALGLLVPLLAHTAFVVAVQGWPRAVDREARGKEPAFQPERLATNVNEVIG